MHRLAPACVLGLSLACGPTPPEQAPADAPADPASPTVEPVATEPPAIPPLVGSHAVVAAGAHFFPSAMAEAPVRTRSYLDHEGVAGSVAAEHVGWVMRVGAVEADRVEVVTLAEGPPLETCGRGFEGLERFELHMWVDRGDLLPVTTAITTVRFEDGSAVRMPSGVPILPAHDQAPARISAWGFELDLTGLDGPPPPTAAAFDPIALPAFERGGSLPQAALMLAGAPVNLGYFLRSDSKAAFRVDDPARVTLRGRCLEVEAVVRSDGLGSFGSGHFGKLGGGGYGGMSTRHFYAVEADAVVRWPDGSEAGRMREAARLEPSTAPGEGYCGYYSVGEGSRDLALCFAEADVRMLPRGYVAVAKLQTKPASDDPTLLRRRVDALASGLRVPCISHAVEADPLLDARVKVRITPGKAGADGEVRLTGEVSEALRACLRERMAAWGVSKQRLDFELQVSARPIEGSAD